MSWADAARTMKVRANADTPLDARTARAFGAEGIGLCRTEHMFFEEERIAGDARDDPRRRLARPRSGAREAPALPARGLRRHLPRDARAAGHDPPARPAAPRVPADRAEAARAALADDGRPGRRSSRSARRTCTSSTRCSATAACRLAITYPEIYAMQVRAILEAAVQRRERGRRRPPGDHDPARDHAGGARADARDRRRGRRRRSSSKAGTTRALHLRHDDRAAARGAPRRRARAAGGVLLVRHERSHAGDDGPVARRRGEVPPGVRRDGDPPEGPVRLARPGGRRRARRDGGRARAARRARS